MILIGARTGVISNPQTIFPEQTDSFSRYFWDGQFSPSGNLFYTTLISIPGGMDSCYLIQYDLNAVNIPLSADTLLVAPLMSNMGQLKLGLDNKIYMSTVYNNFVTPSYPYPDTVYSTYNSNLSVINSPDSLGTACDFQPWSFSLGGQRSYFGLPNNPDYDLGPFIGSACDSLSECHPPTEGLKTVNITSTTAQLKWKKYPNATGYKIRYKQPGLSWQYKTVTHNIGSKVISNLVPGKKYRWAVATICAPGDTAAYSVTKTFTTAAIRQAVYNAEPPQPITELTVHPNPAHDLVQVHFQSGHEQAVIRLIDLTGKTVITKNLNATDDGFNCNVNVSSLVLGLYCLIIYSGDEVVTHKVVKE